MKKDSSHIPTILLCVALVLILAIWLAFPYWAAAHFPESYSKTEAGTFGDMYGSLNALFSGLAFALLIYTALLQRSELQLQRKELEDTRDVFERQTKIQNDNLKLLQDESDRRVELQRIADAPRLMLRNFTWGGRYASMTLINGGAPIFDIRVKSFQAHGAISCKISPDTIVDRNTPAKIDFHFTQLPDDFSARYVVTLAYTDVVDRKCEVELALMHSKDS